MAGTLDEAEALAERLDQMAGQPLGTAGDKNVARLGQQRPKMRRSCEGLCDLLFGVTITCSNPGASITA